MTCVKESEFFIKICYNKENKTFILYAFVYKCGYLVAKINQLNWKKQHCFVILFFLANKGVHFCEIVFKLFSFSFLFANCVIK